MAEKNSSEHTVSHKSRFVRTTMQSWLALTLFITSCAPVVAEKPDVNPKETDLKDYISFYNENGVNFTVATAETGNRSVSVYMADDLNAKVDTVALAKTYSFFEDLDIKQLSYPIVIGGKSVDATVEKNKSGNGTIIVLDQKEGLPEAILKKLSGYEPATANYDQIAQVPAMTISYPDGQFITFIRIDENVDESVVRGWEVAEACNPTIDFRINTPFISEDEMAISQQGTIASDLYCTTYALASLDKSSGLGYSNPPVSASKFNVPKIYVAGVEYQLALPPIFEPEYNSLPSEPYVIIGE